MFGGPVLGRQAASVRDAWGWTLLELLAVLALIALLAALGLAGGQHALEAARTSRARAELAVIAAALEAYRQGFGDFPRTTDGGALLEALLGRRDPAGRAVEARAVLDLGPLAQAARGAPRDAPAKALVDPWELPYRYAYRPRDGDWANPRFVLYSLGPDRAERDALGPGGYPDAVAPENRDNIVAPR